MADIRKRIGKKGTTYQVRYPSKAAKTGYAFGTFNTAKEARAFVENIGALPDRIYSDIRTMPQAVQQWLEICEKVGRDGRETVEPATLVEYRRRARIMLEYRWDKTLTELELSDIVHFRNWLLENRSRDLARRTLSSLHSVLIEMKHQGHLRHDPASGICIKSSGRYEDEDSEVQIPSDQEMRNIYGAADSLAGKKGQWEKTWSRYRPMIYLAGFSGMRPSEYRGLPWQNIFEDHVIVRQRADIKGRIGPVKSRAGKRTIYLPGIVTDMLYEWKERCPQSEFNLVFPTASGRPQLLGRFRKSGWIPLMREADLMTIDHIGGRRIERPKYTLYALRHYFASKLIAQGYDLKFIQETMGHSKIETTLNVYAHLLKDQEAARKENAEALAAEIFKKTCGKNELTPAGENSGL